MPENRICLGGTWSRSIGGRRIDFVPVPGSYAPVGECDLDRQFGFPWDLGADERAFLVTEGVLASAAFVVNGEPIGAAGPWATYRFELPRGLLRRDNAIRARMRDICEGFGPTPGRRFDAGLVRPIWVERRPAAFLESVAFRAKLGDGLRRAECEVQIEIDGRTAEEAEVVLVERDSGREVARARARAGNAARFTVEWPLLWSPRMPHLYVLTVTLPGRTPDSYRECVGFRRIEARGQDLFLNDKRLVLKGVCRHEFTSASGYSPTEDEVRRELAMVKHAGFNYVRLVHSPQAGCVPRIAAELGLLVSEEPGTCFHDLSDERIYGPAFEVLLRTVRRDRNVPSILAWLIYNECNPNAAYAVKAARICREIDPGCRLGMADCSGRDDDIRAMVKAADMTFYGINVYSHSPHIYAEKMKSFEDRPLVFTEWGGVTALGNHRIFRDLCKSFVRHVQPGEPLRMAGCSYWAWADYEEHSRGEPAAIEGWTVEGLLDQRALPRPDLQIVAQMCFEMENPEPARAPKVEVLSPAPRREEDWLTIPLDRVGGDQSATERTIEEKRFKYGHGDCGVAPPTPKFGRLQVDGIEFLCRDAGELAHPLLLSRERPELRIPVGLRLRGIAILGHVAFLGGYPASTIWSVHHKDAEAAKAYGALASEYEFAFEDGFVVQPLRHGVEILRSNDICRWWTPSPRAPETRPAAQSVIHPSYEILRVDLWTKEFPEPRTLKDIRWRLADADSIQMLYAVSVRT